MLTKEELMQPRYKVIALWPGAEIQIDDILMTGVVNAKAGWYSQNGNKIHGPEFYPHLFKPLKWWEERKPEDMPEYVKEVEDERIYVYRSGKDFKYLTASKNIGLRMKDDKRMIQYMYLQPATESEYQSYTNSLK